MQNCPIERRVEVTSGTMNLATGERTRGQTETRVEPCNTPLFGKEAEAGICSGCASGWAVDGNRPTLAGIAMIAELTGGELEIRC